MAKDTFRKKFSRKRAVRAKRLKKSHHGNRPTFRAIKKPD